MTNTLNNGRGEYDLFGPRLLSGHQNIIALKFYVIQKYKMTMHLWQLTEAAYTSAAGPIAPQDILYEHREAMNRGNLYMAHRCGFTRKMLQGTLQAAGFRSVATLARGRAPFFDLFALASKSARSEEEMRKLVALHFPAWTFFSFIKIFPDSSSS